MRFYLAYQAFNCDPVVAVVHLFGLAKQLLFDRGVLELEFGLQHLEFALLAPFKLQPF